MLFVYTNTIFCQANWHIVRNPWKGDFKDVYFLPSSQIGWAVGASFYDTSGTYLGNVAHTINGGQTWLPQKASTHMFTLNAVYFTDENCGWLVGGYGLINHTTDGGQTWASQSSPVSKNLHSLSFIDSLRGWVFGLDGYVLHTVDAGNTWTIQYQLSDSLWIEDGIFKDSLTGWVVGYSFTTGGRIYKTTDGGNSWFMQVPGTNCNFYGVDFYDLNLGWAVTAAPLGDITRTTDGGATWSVVGQTVTSLLDINFADSLNGWIVGEDGAIYYSTDGGLTWNLQYNPIHNELWSVSTSDNQNVWVVGKYGIILHTTDAGNIWDYQASGVSNDLFGIDASDSLNIWAIGGDYDRTVLHSSDGGYTWQHQDVGLGSGYLRGVSFPDSLYGITGGFGGLIYTTSDGGESWTPRDPGMGVWYSVELLDSSKGWIASEDGGKIKSTRDGGNSWVTQYDQYGQHFEDIMFLNDTLGWACGFIDYHNSFVVRTTDGGQFWNCDTLPIAQGYLWSIDFVSPYIGFIVGDYGEIYKTVNGGITWNSFQNDTLGTSFLNKVDFVDSLNGWVVSSNTVFRTRNGGNTWQTDRRLPGYPSGGNAKGLVALDTLHAWLCMDDGKILSYGTITGVKEKDLSANGKKQSECIPLKINPNPFYTSLNLFYSLPHKSTISLKLYSASGRFVKTIFNGTQSAGTHSIHPDLNIPSGIYFLRLKRDNKEFNCKLIKMKK